MDKYLQWILDLNLTPESAQGKCTIYTPLMAKVFPDLKIKKGVVFSKYNPDNYSDILFKQYPHTWLEDPEGNIIDPTKIQFLNLINLEYKELNGTIMCKCINCGNYFMSEYSKGTCSNECSIEFSNYLK